MIHEFQDSITAATLHPSTLVGETVELSRPLVQQQLLEAHGNPTEADAPAHFFDNLRIAEEALRRPILRALGYAATTTLMERTLDTLANGVERQVQQDWTFMFSAESGHGRVHNGARGEFVRSADHALRSAAATAFSGLKPEKEQELFSTFWDISQRVRDLSALALDHRIGDSWRKLDPADISRVQVTELDGKKLSRYDRHLLLKTQKPLDIHKSFGNATATAAEFTAIGVEAMSRELSKAGVLRNDWYAYSFAHINKLSFGAKLPFWAAQDFAIAANASYPPSLFQVGPRWPSRYHVSYARTAHENYYSNENIGDCQGIFVPDLASLTFEEKRLRRDFIRGLFHAAQATNVIAWPDVPKAEEVTSADSATALALSIAYRGQYNL